MGEYNKPAAKKIGPLEIIKFNPNSYQLKLPSHIKMSDVFNVWHPILYVGDSYDNNMNLRANSL